MRRLFASELLKYAKEDKDIIVVSFDLGYKMWDEIAKLPGQFYNVGASESAGIGIAVGLALSGKKVFCYSITNFLIYRPFEFIRNYLNEENIPVRLVASGRGKDYLEDGISHHSEDAKSIMHCFYKIDQYWPEEKEEIPDMVRKMIDTNNRSSFISLRR